MALANLIQSELNAAVINADEEAIKRFSLLISEKIVRIDKVESEQTETKSDLRALIDTVKFGFERMDQRFEAMDQRFEDLQRSMDKRFESMDKRFESMDKRFEDLQRSIDKRFDMMFKFMSLGFSIITVLIVVFKFIQ